jgi:hypothetical protein
MNDDQMNDDTPIVLTPDQEHVLLAIYVLADGQMDRVIDVGQVSTFISIHSLQETRVMATSIKKKNLQ